MRRRVVSLWLPRLAAERVLRREGLGPDAETPLAVLSETRGALRIASLNRAAEAAGLRRGMAQADARALRPDLRTALYDPPGQERCLDALRRWAMRYSPWVGLDETPSAPDGPAREAPGEGALALDVTGCAHLFGGEAEMLADMAARLARIGFTARLAAADGKGAAWALARFGPREGDAPIVAPPGSPRAALSELPLAALRLEPDAVDGLTRLGVKSAGELALIPRASLARRFGVATVRRVDQALGAEPEPVAPSAPPPVYAARMSLPEPIGTTADVRAGLDRLLDRLCGRLERDGVGARLLRLTLRRVDRSDQSVEVRLARAGRDPARIGPLFEKPVESLEAGFGIDALRLRAVEIERLSARQTHAGPDRADPRGGDALEDLTTRLGGRLGFERITRLLPAESHLPDRAHIVAPAAYSAPAADWPSRAAARPPRPVNAFAPEPLQSDAPHARAAPPSVFQWRGRAWRVVAAAGPERIAPEWWLDDPDWRSGLRDYWRVETEEGRRLWLFRTPQAEPPGWFAAGEFA